MGRIISYIMENKKCPKPPTRWGLANHPLSVAMNDDKSYLNPPIFVHNSASALVHPQSIPVMGLKDVLQRSPLCLLRTKTRENFALSGQKQLLTQHLFKYNEQAIIV